MYYISAWERLGYKQLPLCEFLDSDISEINRGRNINFVRWWMCRPTASKTGSNGRPAHDCETLIM